MLPSKSTIIWNMQKECQDKKKKLEKQLAELRVWEEKLKKQEDEDKDSQGNKRDWQAREVILWI
jgi:hypothetical protein